MADESQHGTENKQNEPKPAAAPEKDDLEKKVQEGAKKQQEAQKAAAQEAVKHEAQNQQNLEQRVNQTIFERAFTSTVSGVYNMAKPLWTPTWTIGGGLAAYAIGGLGPLIFGVGLATGRYFLDRYKGLPFTLDNFLEEYAKALITGIAIAPLSGMINAAPTLTAKLATFFGLLAPAFMASDIFQDYYIKKYKNISALYKDINSRWVTKIVGEGLAHTIRKTPKTYYDWCKNTKFVLPALAASNWIAGYGQTLKYAIATLTSAAYRFFTGEKKKPATAPQYAGATPAYAAA